MVNFKRREVGFKCLDFNVGPARIRAFNHTSNPRHTTNPESVQCFISEKFPKLPFAVRARTETISETVSQKVFCWKVQILHPIEWAGVSYSTTATGLSDFNLKWSKIRLSLLRPLQWINLMTFLKKSRKHSADFFLVTPPFSIVVRTITKVRKFSVA